MRTVDENHVQRLGVQSWKNVLGSTDVKRHLPLDPALVEVRDTPRHLFIERTTHVWSQPHIANSTVDIPSPVSRVRAPGEHRSAMYS